ncbi:MAG: peroxiredoxin [Pseudomonadota bacterium]|nr:peroxiredoxin [Pseudomonadota bacterium]
MLHIPRFKLATTLGRDIKLADYAGQNIVLYFYPKDNTPGCTKESKDFRDSIAEFKKLNTVVFGVSRDPLASHAKFKEKHCMPFELISDHDEKLCRHFDVLKEKNLFGLKYVGLVRSTFLIDAKGDVVKEWRKVKVIGHVADVLKAARTIVC